MRRLAAGVIGTLEVRLDRNESLYAELPDRVPQSVDVVPLGSESGHQRCESPLVGLFIIQLQRRRRGVPQRNKQGTSPPWQEGTILTPHTLRNQPSNLSDDTQVLYYCTTVLWRAERPNPIRLYEIGGVLVDRVVCEVHVGEVKIVVPGVLVLACANAHEALQEASERNAAVG